MDRANLSALIASKVRSRRSIGGNLHLMTSVVFIILAVAIAGGYSYLFSRLSLAERMDNVNAFGRTLSSLIARPVSVGDYLSVEQSLQGSALQDFICSIRVVNPEDMPVGNVENSKSKLCKPRLDATTLRFPIVTSAALDPAGTRQIGYVVLKVSLADLHASTYQSMFTALMLGAVILLFLLLLNRIAVDVALLPLKRAVMVAESTSRENIPNLDLPEAAPLEIRPLLRTFKSLFTEYAKAEGDIQAGKVARQAAHDIRSPLAALEMMAHSSSKMAEGERVILRQAATRIRDIANDLSGRYREGTAPMEAAGESQLIPVLIDEIVTEMRMRHRAQSGLEIAANMDERNYGLFASIDPIGFKRALSNVIQNAVEAIPGVGQVNVRSETRDGRVFIEVSDTGHGVPADILPLLGERGATFGRAHGSGLGLHYAKEVVEKAGGSLEIESKQDHGTTVRFILPLSTAPEWFVPKLDLSSGSTVVILDDDQSIHQVWSERLSHWTGSATIHLQHFATARELREWCLTHSEIARSAMYLLDFELIGEVETGITVIESLGLQDRAIIVSSRYEESGVREACARNHVRLIPKGLAAFVPISIQSVKISAVLIDDDSIAHTLLGHIAEQKSKRVLTVFSESELDGNDIPQDTPIYVDRHLGNGVSGENVLVKLYEKGFTNLYLTTGDTVEKDELPELGFLRGVVGKGFAAELFGQA